MVSRSKVVPPVTPKIILQHNRHRHLQLALLFAVFLFIVWFSYDLGRSQAPEWVIGDAGEIQPDDSDERIDALQKQRDTLQQQLDELQKRLARSDQALAEAQSRIHTLQRSARATAGEPAPATPEPAAVTEPAVSEDAGTIDHRLELANLSILPTESVNVYRISLSVMHAGDDGGRVTGTLWIAVNGFNDKQPVRLSLKRLSPERRSYVKMGFDRQQDILQEITLPENFRPKNVLIEAKPYGDKYTGTSAKIDWDL